MDRMIAEEEGIVSGLYEEALRKCGEQGSI
jgi:hypothetical protein